MPSISSSVSRPRRSAPNNGVQRTFDQLTLLDRTQPDLPGTTSRSSTRTGSLATSNCKPTGAPDATGACVDTASQVSISRSHAAGCGGLDGAGRLERQGMGLGLA